MKLKIMRLLYLAFQHLWATNVIIDELYPIIGHKCWMIDFGSTWDPFIGNFNRSHHKNYKTTQLDLTINPNN